LGAGGAGFAAPGAGGAPAAFGGVGGTAEAPEPSGLGLSGDWGALGSSAMDPVTIILHCNDPNSRTAGRITTQLRMAAKGYARLEGP